ncbi:hypothetical protein Q5P01_018536 [Channa striata]|uniref:Uncharacterized protein n=1 Tax=Channa striata TaxID=64152 RepID=A0AA88M4N3_CHASR|nr:hypothetical protein Q5P01_018536 [Channa striata]
MIICPPLWSLLTKDRGQQTYSLTLSVPSQSIGRGDKEEDARHLTFSVPWSFPKSSEQSEQGTKTQRERRGQKKRRKCDRMDSKEETTWRKM